MTFREGDRSIGAFRQSGRGGPMSFGNCSNCGGIFRQEWSRPPVQGFGSMTRSSDFYYKKRQKEEAQVALGKLFGETSNRCTCDPEGDQIYLLLPNTSPPPITDKPTLKNTYSDLKILDDLSSGGVLTPQQYETAKRKALSSYLLSFTATELMWSRVKKLLDQFRKGLPGS